MMEYFKNAKKGHSINDQAHQPSNQAALSLVQL